MGRTKKVGVTGRYGSRLGKTIRSRIIAVEVDLRKRWQCPNCLKKDFRRASAGIWECGKCGHKAAGKAYRPA